MEKMSIAMIACSPPSPSDQTHETKEAFLPRSADGPDHGGNKTIRTVLGKRATPSPKQANCKLVAALPSAPFRAQNGGCIVNREEDEKSSDGYDDVLHPRESVSVGESGARKTGGKILRKVYVSAVHGRSTMPSFDDANETCVLVQWNETRSNGNVMEWISEGLVEEMMGGLEAVQKYQWHRNPPHGNIPVLPPLQQVDKLSPVSEPLAPPAFDLPSAYNVSLTGHGSRSISTSGHGPLGSKKETEVYELLRDQMRLQKRQERSNSMQRQ